MVIWKLPLCVDGSLLGRCSPEFTQPIRRFIINIITKQFLCVIAYHWSQVTRGSEYWLRQQFFLYLEKVDDKVEFLGIWDGKEFLFYSPADDRLFVNVLNWLWMSRANVDSVKYFVWHRFVLFFWKCASIVCLTMCCNVV